MKLSQHRPGWAIVLIVVSVVLVLTAAVWAWVHVPELYPAPPASVDQAVDATREATRSQAIVTTRASVLAALAGLGAMITIAINYRNSAIANRNVEVANRNAEVANRNAEVANRNSVIAAETLATTNRTFEITARGHLTDRYTKAIEHLGSEDSMAIRLGGIYALQQFAVETDRDEDQTTIVEVLSAFVRTKLPRRADRVSNEGAAGESSSPDASPQLTSREPDPDILAAISALAQLPVRDGSALRADFSGVDFKGIRLSPGRLENANLAGTFLRSALLHEANLNGSILRGGDLDGAILSRASLIGADLAGAHLYRADLSGANIRGANLHDADLRDANLRGADLDGARLAGASLYRAALCGANLGRANLRGADLRGADLRDAHLREANMDGARVQRTQLSFEQQTLVRNLPELAVGQPGGDESPFE